MRQWSSENALQYWDRKSTESIDDFVAQLKQLIIGCRNNPYGGGYEEDLIRDQIADKMRDTSLREKSKSKLMN